MEETTFRPAPTPPRAERPTQQIRIAPESSPPPQYESCEECGSAVDTDQRYCVVCGTRRKHVYDPAARFLSTATARSRRTDGQARRPAPARRGRFQSVGTALAIAVVPVAIGVGVAVGKSGSGTDQKLLNALRSQKEVVNVGGGALASTRASSGPSTTSTKHRSRSSKNSSSSSKGKTLSTTSNGTFTSLTSTKPPSRTQLNHNANIVKKVQGTINQHYVDSQKNLPNSIAVP